MTAENAQAHVVRVRARGDPACRGERGVRAHGGPCGGHDDDGGARRRPGVAGARIRAHGVRHARQPRRVVGVVGVRGVVRVRGVGGRGGSARREAQECARGVGQKPVHAYERGVRAAEKLDAGAEAVRRRDRRHEQRRRRERQSLARRQRRRAQVRAEKAAARGQRVCLLSCAPHHGVRDVLLRRHRRRRRRRRALDGFRKTQMSLELIVRGARVQPARAPGGGESSAPFPRAPGLAVQADAGGLVEEHVDVCFARVTRVRGVRVRREGVGRRRRRRAGDPRRAETPEPGVRPRRIRAGARRGTKRLFAVGGRVPVPVHSGLPLEAAAACPLLIRERHIRAPAHHPRVVLRDARGVVREHRAPPRERVARPDLPALAPSRRVRGAEVRRRARARRRERRGERREHDRHEDVHQQVLGLSEHV